MKTIRMTSILHPRPAALALRLYRSAARALEQATPRAHGLAALDRLDAMHGAT